MSPNFRYHAKDDNGIDIEGTIEALNEVDAAKKLKERSLYIISLEAIAEKRPVSELKLNLLLVKGLLFLVNCFKCKKQLGRFSIKKIMNNKFICNSCFEATKIENKKIIDELIYKYLSKKEDIFCYNLRYLYEMIWDIGLEPYSLENAKEIIRNRLSNLKIKKTTGDIDTIISLKNTFESWLIFLEDLDKMQKLLKNKGIDVDYLTILAMFIEFMDVENDKMIENAVTAMHKIIIESFGQNVSKEAVIALLMEGGWRFDSDFRLEALYKLLDKLNLSFRKEEIENLIKEAKERIELKEFEQSLGSQRKAGIGDFENLNGHGFEGYAHKLFELLGYTVVRTSLTGDQGADLIISKDGTKTVVQAKKYEGNVSNKAIQEVVAAKNYYKAEKAMVVTNSSFTKGAMDLALANNVDLWDGEKLENIVKNLGVKKEQVHEQTIECSSKEDKKTIVVACPSCKKEFDYEMNTKELKNSEINEITNFELLCPHCGATIVAKTQKTKILTWSCQYCSQVFDNQEDCEKHEKECGLKKNDSSNN